MAGKQWITARLAIRLNKSHEAVHCPNKRARDCQWSRKRFCGRAENALYSYRHCMTNLWTSTKSRWSMNSWMVVSPRALQKYREHKQCKLWLILAFNWSFTLTSNYGEMLLMLKENVGTLRSRPFQEWLCVCVSFPEDVAYSIQYMYTVYKDIYVTKKGNRCCCSTSCSVFMSKPSAAFTLPVIVT